MNTTLKYDLVFMKGRVITCRVTGIEFENRSCRAISSDPPCKDNNSRFTRQRYPPKKLCLIKSKLDIKVYNLENSSSIVDS